MGRPKGSRNSNDTVRCGYCYNTGHNRRSCPDLHGNRSAGGTVKSSKKRVASAPKARRKNKTRCGYCTKNYYFWSDNGKAILEESYYHNRRNCPQAVKDAERYYEQNAVYRANYKKLMEENQIGVGAIIEVDRYFSRNFDKEGKEIPLNYEEIPPSVFMITEIRWDDINRNDIGSSTDSPIRGVCFNYRNKNGKKREVGMDFRTHFGKGYYSNRTKVVSVAPHPLAGMPKNWVSDRDHRILNYVRNLGQR